MTREDPTMDDDFDPQLADRFRVLDRKAAVEIPFADVMPHARWQQIAAVGPRGDAQAQPSDR